MTRIFGARIGPRVEDLALASSGDDMVSNMKTTIDIADSLLAEAKALAAREGTTVRSLVEEGLRLAIHRHGQQGPFRLRDASFAGDGLRPDVSLERWDQIRGMIYGGRGG
jgi:hypothetical protein